jgi:hypothetical protein
MPNLSRCPVLLRCLSEHTPSPTHTHKHDDHAGLHSGQQAHHHHFIWPPYHVSQMQCLQRRAEPSPLNTSQCEVLIKRVVVCVCECVRMGVFAKHSPNPNAFFVRTRASKSTSDKLWARLLIALISELTPWRLKLCCVRK